ncbi:peptidoglycan bridge formation glycyltransferase FemA/FemB family protein [Candidatus Saccharibacteria bacterium]|nr:peptidoglycan bridge formation glycyltransferase FemA/FemB family protein [Candidatus Saccharibacteria bacterium]MCB9821708.1 peptidoglycan bridge formation glycyltransferase FemA/FemB family protein [Candidatus Nomurabacteria bacterium]
MSSNKFDLSLYPEANFLVSPAYLRSQAGLNRVIEYIDHDLIITGVIREARRGRYLEVAGNPLTNWQNPELAQRTVNKLAEICRQNKCVFARVRPQLEANQNNLEVFKNLGFVPAPMHLLAEDTILIDLRQTEEELMAGMRKGTRYEVRQSQKLGIKINQLDISQQNIEKFANLLVETADRQHYVVGSIEQIKLEIAEMGVEGMIDLLEAVDSSNQLLNMAVIVRYNQEADYLYGASSLVGRKLPGAYGLQWEAMRIARRAGSTRYNMWGVAPEGAPANHRFAGVTTFKKGFGGDYYHFLPAQDLVVNKPKYQLNKVVETIRRKRRHL